MMNTTTSKNDKKYTTTIDIVRTTKNIVLEGLKVLRVEMANTTYNVIKEVNPQTNQTVKVSSKRKISEELETLTFSLVEVEPKQLSMYRKNKVSSFVLKIDEKLYHTEIPSSINFMAANIFPKHQCASPGHECNRLSAADDAKGGCEKVRNYSNRIEKYPWITSGYETFNTKHNSFVVGKCLHYEKCPPRKSVSLSERNKAKLSLAQFVWDDAENLVDVKARKEKNMGVIDNY